MGNVQKVIHNVDCAIIEVLKSEGNNWLKRNYIIGRVKKYPEINVDVGKRIAQMYKKGYLIRDPDKKPLYKLNPDIDFDCSNWKFQFSISSKDNRDDAAEIPYEVRRQHTKDLQKLITNWMGHFPLPTTDMPLNSPTELTIETDYIYYEDPLFPDLMKHMALTSSVCEKFRDYKTEIEELKAAKQELYDVIKDELKKCFEILDIEPATFPTPPHSEIYYYDMVGQGSLGRSVYNSFFESAKSFEDYQNTFDFVVFDMENEYHSHKFIVHPATHSDENGNISIGDRFYWALIKNESIPEEKQEYVSKATANFINFYRNCRNTELSGLAASIKEKIKALEQEKYEIVKELGRLLNYSAFPGDCEYLGAR